MQKLKKQKKSVKQKSGVKKIKKIKVKKIKFCRKFFEEICTVDEKSCFLTKVKFFYRKLNYQDF